MKFEIMEGERARRGVRVWRRRARSCPDARRKQRNPDGWMRLSEFRISASDLRIRFSPVLYSDVFGSHPAIRIPSVPDLRAALISGFELGVIEICVESAFCQEFFVSSLFYDIAVFHNQDQIRVADG